MNEITMGSLFDGQAGFPLAAAIYGIKTLWASEVEPFPILVTRKRFPNMKHVGDISKIDGSKLAPVDVVTGGSPCQDLSVAGKRKGLKHSELGDSETTRSGLFMEQIRVVKEMRNESITRSNGYVQPRFMVWENVPGAFSSNKGEDFRAVLEETARVKDSNAVIPRPPNGKWADAGAIMGNGWSIAWRVLDAQFWGVPQRRRRIVLVADFDGECAGEILFKRDGLSRHIETSGEKGQGIAADAERRFGETIGFDAYQHHNWRESDKLGVLTTGVGRVRGDTPLVMEMTHADEVIRFHDKGVVPTLQSRMGTGGNQVPMVYDIQGSMIGRADENGPQGNGVNEDVMFTLNTTDRHGVVYGICSDASNSMKSSNPRSSIYEAETSRTLDANGGNPACNQGGMAVVGTFSLQRSDEYKQSDVACTQARRQYKDSTDLVIASVDCRNFNETEMHGTLQAKENGGQSLNYMGAVRTGYAVRRLIPTEYLRLQAFPDWWFDDLAIDNPTEDDLIFWQEVFDTHARINGNKPKSRKQIIKWLKNPYSDSAAYKACGNSVATVCMEYVMEGIREVLGRG